MAADDGAYGRFLSGDDAAFAELVSAYRTGLTRYIAGIVGDESLAEDLTEDVFVRLWIRRPRRADGSSFKTWLYTVGRNLALDALRRMKRRGETPAAELSDLADAAPSPEEEHLRDENAAAVERALKVIRPDYASALRLMYYEGFTVREIARITGKTARGTSDMLYRAKQSLRKQLEKEGFEYEDR